METRIFFGNWNLGTELDGRNAEIGSDQIFVYERFKDMNASEYKRGKNKDSFAKKQYFFSSF